MSGWTHWVGKAVSLARAGFGRTAGGVARKGGL